MNPICAILIPAYKPSPELVSLVKTIIDTDTSTNLGEILIVDDGSGPDFSGVFASLAPLPKVTILRHAVNLGKGAALKTGFNYLLTKSEHYLSVVTADADGQHSPTDILRLLDASTKMPECLILGTRTFNRDIPLRSFIGNSATRAVCRFLTGISVSDTQTGLRAWPRDMCALVLRINVNGYDFEMESMLYASQNMGAKFMIKELPIETIYLDDNSSSHFNPILDSMRIYFVFARYCSTSLVTALVDYLVFMVTYSILGSVGLGLIFARSVAVFVGFFMSRSIVFKSDMSWKISFARFMALVVAMGFISYGLIQWMHATFGMGVVLSKILAEGLLFLGNFAIQRDFIFKKKLPETN